MRTPCSRWPIPRDGKRLLTSSYDNTARLWDVEKREEESRLPRARLVGLVGGVLAGRAVDCHGLAGWFGHGLGC